MAKGLVRSLFFAITLGVASGLIFGQRVVFLGAAGSLMIRVLKDLAIPLLFFGIVDTFCKTRIEARDGARLIAISTLNAAVALVIALSVAHLVPGAWFTHFPRFSGAGARLAKAPAVDSLVLLIGAALVIGIGIRVAGLDGDSPVAKVFSKGYRATYWLLSWVVRAIPIAIFCILARITGNSGLAAFPALAVFVGVVVLGMLIQVGAYYSLLLKAKGFAPAVFFRDSAPALLTAFSLGSSLATLPVTLETLERKRGIAPRYARLAAAIGTNLNHAGIILYEAAAALFVARLYGIELTLPQQASLCLTSIVAAVGIAGIPDAGLITLSLVLASARLPLEAVSLLLPLDWLIGRMRATVNVASDMTVAHLLVVKTRKPALR